MYSTAKTSLQVQSIANNPMLLYNVFLLFSMVLVADVDFYKKAYKALQSKYISLQCLYYFMIGGRFVNHRSLANLAIN